MNPVAGRFAKRALVIFFVALGVRLVHLWQIRHAPFFSVLMGDSRGYDLWARRIAGGDWVGSDVFYQAPLYPYFLGTIYAIAGANLFLVRVCQAVLGSAACVLLGLAAARMWSRAAGLVAGLALALYAPAIFFDSLIQKTVLDVFFVCLALYLISRIIEGPAEAGPLTTGSSVGSAFRRIREWLFLGLALGGLTLTRENAMVFVVVTLAWIAFRDRSQTSIPVPADSLRKKAKPVAARRSGRMAEAAAFVLGLAIVLLPVAVRNTIVGGGFYVTTAQFGPNFYLGNNPTADGTAQSLRVGRGAAEYERQDATELAEQAMARRLTPGEVSQFWTDRAMTYITSQPGAWLALMARKFALLWNRTEMLDTESQESYAEWSTPIRLGSIAGHFGVLVPAAIVGVLLRWRDRRRLWVLYLMMAAYAASVLMFFVYARYRFPLVPFLVLFAAAGIVEVARLLGVNELRTSNSSETGTETKTETETQAPAAMPRRNRRALRRGISVRTRWGWGPSASEKMLTLTVAAPLLLAAIVFTNWPVLSPNLMRAITEHNLGAALQSDGHLDEAIVHYRRALEFKPDHAPALNNLGTALSATGHPDQAIESYEQALKIAPDYASAHYNLANALLRGGKNEAAAEHFRLALQSTPGSVELHNNLAIALAEEGRTNEAIAEFRKALEYDPSSAKTHRNLASVLAAAGRREEAIDALRQAVKLDPRDGPARYDLATLLVETDNVPEAVDEFRAALELMPGSVDVHNNLGIALGSLGRLDEAIDIFRRALSLQPDFAPAQRNLQAALDLRRKMAAPPRR